MNSVYRRFFPFAFVACIAAGRITAPARAEDKAATVVTPKNATEHVGEKVTAEFTVTNSKFSERRKIHFLISGANFRGKDSLSVAIREADAEKFKKTGGEDFAAKFAGQNIRVRGQLVEDEGQRIVFISSPADIDVLSANAGQSTATGELVIVNQAGERKIFALPLAKDLPRSEVTYEHDGEKETFTGVPVATLLEKAGVTLGAEARGVSASRYVLFSAADGYLALLAIAEIDPFMTDEVVLLAEQVNGQPLPARRTDTTRHPGRQASATLDSAAE